MENIVKASMPAFQLIKRGKHSIVMAPYLIQHYSIKHLNNSNTTFNTAKYCYPVALHYTTMHLGMGKEEVSLQSIHTFYFIRIVLFHTYCLHRTLYPPEFSSSRLSQASSVSV